MSKIFEYSVLATRYTTPKILVLTLQSNKRQTLSFAPGQYAAISFKGKNNQMLTARCFSLTSTPTDTKYLQFGIDIGKYPDSISETLVNGTDILVKGPMGEFSFVPERDRSVMLLAEGDSIMPFISIIRYAARQQLDCNIALVYCCNNQDDIPYLGELIELKRLNPHFGIMFVINEGKVDKLQGQYTTSTLDGNLLDYLLVHNYAGRSYFVAGSQTFRQRAAALLLDKGAPPGSVLVSPLVEGEKSL